MLYFYKYLQPCTGRNSNSVRKLQLNVPLTVVCEKRENREEVLWLTTDANGAVVRDDKVQVWRRRLLLELSDGDVPLDAVVAVRNVAHWRGKNNKTVVVTKRNFDQLLNAPTELAFSVQRYVRCRGTHSSIYRVVWSEKQHLCFAVNICNE